MQKKELLRCLISHVIFTRQAPGTVAVKIVWVSGHCSIQQAWQPTHATHDLPNFDAMVERVKALWQRDFTAAQIAAQLTQEGYRSAYLPHVTPTTVQKIRLKYGWRHPPSHYQPHLEVEGYLTITQLAARLGVKRRWVYSRIRKGQIDPNCVTRHSKYNTFLIRDDPELIAQLCQQL